MAKTIDHDDFYDEDGKHIPESKADREDYHGDSPITSGSKQSFSCPECGSWNTEESVFYECCNSCGWEQGY